RIEVRLEIEVVAKVMLMFEALDTGVRIPLLAVDLVAADMKVLVWKHPGHLADEVVEKVVGLVARWVHGRVMNAEVARDRIWAGSGRQFRIRREPTRGVSGDVEFRHHADASVASVRD